MDFQQSLGQNPQKSQNLQNPWISSGFKVIILNNQKIYRFQLKIHRFWMGFRLQSSKITKSAKFANFGQKSMDFGWIEGQMPHKPQILQNPQILAANPQILGGFKVRILKNHKFCRFWPKSMDFQQI